MEGFARRVTPGEAPAEAAPLRSASAASHLPAARPGVLVIGASTGGPQALVALLSGLGGATRLVPTCVTLHMPPGLMAVVAGSIARQCGIDTCVVEEPRSLLPGPVYFAPGDRHLGYQRRADRVELTLVAAGPRARCKPAVDTMFGEAAAVFRARTLAVVLSGMGVDGLAGARAIVAGGGTVLVQDKATSAVWGMPGAVAKAGLAAAALPPDAIAVELARRLRPAEGLP